MNDQFAVDENGNPLPYSQEEIKRISRKIAEKGELVLVISRIENSFAANVFGPPSKEVLEQLEIVTEAYRKALRGM